MPNVRYIGTSHFREIAAKDWKSVGVEDQGKVVWDRDSKKPQEINDAAWAWLQENDGADYELVEEVQPNPVTPPIPPPAPEPDEE